ncbi:hypothetical protein V3C99_011007 [Haemonchus contortus]
MSFQPAFNARLIAEVKKHPCLYNHSKRGSGDTMERMRIWDMIAAAVDSNCSGDFAKKRWLQLRDRYRKELKTAIKHNFVTPIRWCYFSHLSWLDPYLKDNLVLSACDGYGDNSDSYSNCVDGLSLNNVKAELDDGDCEQSPSLMEASVIDRLLASTHQISRQQKVSDPSDDQSLTAHGGEEEPRIIAGKSEDTAAPKEPSEKKCERTEATIQMSQPFSTSALKTQMMARYQQMEQAVIKQAMNAGRNMLDWINDEDYLYCRIIGIRLKKMDPRKRKRVRAQIMSLLEESEGELEEDDDSMSSPNVDGVESSGFDHSLLDSSGKFDDH